MLPGPASYNLAALPRTATHCNSSRPALIAIVQPPLLRRVTATSGAARAAGSSGMPGATARIDERTEAYGNLMSS